VYAAALIARAREHAAELAMRVASRQGIDVEHAVAAGIDVSAQALGATAATLDARYIWLAAADSASDAESELRSVLALPVGTRLELEVPDAPTEALATLDSYTAKGLAASPDIAAASAALEQARHATTLARADYIPDLGVAVTMTTLDGVSFLRRHAVGFGVQGSWTILDWGKRGAVSRERAAQENAASIGVALARDRVSVEIERAYRDAQRAERGAEVARAALDARRAAFRITQDRAARGLIAGAALASAEADVAESEARALAASLQVRLGRAALRRAAGG
jgi:multidrug efflux system outer membrane protein